MKGWVGLVSWPVVDGLPTIHVVVTHQLQVERGIGKVCRPETDVLPLYHSTNQSLSMISKILTEGSHRAGIEIKCGSLCCRSVIIFLVLSLVSCSTVRQGISMVQPSSECFWSGAVDVIIAVSASGHKVNLTNEFDFQHGISYYYCIVSNALKIPFLSYGHGTDRRTDDRIVVLLFANIPHRRAGAYHNKSMRQLAGASIPMGHGDMSPEYLWRGGRPW